MAQLRIELEKLEFTTGEVIKGALVVSVHKELTISCIQVKLEGMSKTSLMVQARQDSQKFAKHTEEHMLLHETRTVLPSQASGTKEISLTPGDYSYEFEFTVPLMSSCGLDSSGKKPLVGRALRTKSSRVYSHNKGSLPPSLNDVNDSAEIVYFLKATIRRPSILKSNIRKTHPLKICPFDPLDQINHNGNISFIRKEHVFEDKLPEIIAIVDNPTKPTISQIQPLPPSPQRRSSGFLRSLFFGADDINNSHDQLPPPLPMKNDDPPTITAFDVPFYFEARFNGFFQLVGKPPPFTLFVLSKVHPKRYLGINGTSSGLGAIYLRTLKIELMIITNIQAQQAENMLTHVLELCSLSTSGRLDLAYGYKSKAINEQNGSHLYELEIPSSIFKNAIIPTSMPQTFQACNIQRSYKLKITGGFSESKNSKRIKNIELITDLVVLKGLLPPNSSIQQDGQVPGYLPTYDDVMNSNS